LFSDDLGIRVSENDRENLHYFYTDRQIYNFFEARETHWIGRVEDLKNLQSLLQYSHGQPAALKISDAVLLQSESCRYFGAKSTKSLEKVQILALNMRIF
jgi:hypothetical protein